VDVSGDADILAWEPSTDGIDCNSIGSKSSCIEFSDVMVARHLWPVFVENAAREFFDLTESNGLEAATPFQPEAETANTAEEVEQT